MNDVSTKKFQIVDSLEDKHIDNNRIYSIGEAISFVNKLLEVEKEDNFDVSNYIKLGEPCAQNLEAWLEHFCYELKEVGKALIENVDTSVDKASSRVVLYGETQDTILDVLSDAIKNTNDAEEKAVLVRTLHNWNDFVDSLEPSGLFGKQARTREGSLEDVLSNAEMRSAGMATREVGKFDLEME